MNFDVIWNNLLNQIKDELSSLAYDTWFAETKLYKLEDNKATIIVPMPIHKNHLKDNYSEIITSKLLNLTDSNYELIFVLSEEIEEEQNDGIKIANDVVAVIAGVAVSEVAGVASMSGGFAGGISEVLSGKKNLSKGIKVDSDEKEVKIDVNIIVEYGSRIPDVAFEIQNRVKKSVENMTGLKVAEVNVHVQGVKTEREVDEEELEKEDKE